MNHLKDNGVNSTNDQEDSENDSFSHLVVLMVV